MSEGNLCGTEQKLSGLSAYSITGIVPVQGLFQRVSGGGGVLVVLSSEDRDVLVLEWSFPANETGELATAGEGDWKS